MISNLQYITQDIEGKSHVQLAKEACKAGVTWVQLRLKKRSVEECKSIAIETLAICRKYNTRLIINDHADIAMEIGADGVHLGKEDMKTVDARKKYGAKLLIGGTANTIEDIRMHAAAGVDYIGLGPFRFTSTKEKLSPILGAEGYKRIISECVAENIKIPIIAIGGITVEYVSEIMRTGVYGVAVAGAIAKSENKKETVDEFLKKLNSKTSN